MIINGMEVYMANAHRLSLIFKYINDQTDLDLETFKNTDNNPPFFCQPIKHKNESIRNY